uniref:Uncharacterized protein n=1 Tax=Rhizophora mucronata TaxID=61149 RepID=A0A2P2PA17_RHIMU
MPYMHRDFSSFSIECCGAWHHFMRFIFPPKAIIRTQK